MNGELLSALERIERQKGIDKDILFEAIESALVSAARKVIDDPDISKEDITVQIDKETGEIHVYSDESEIRSGKFGRIAAQTAKQVMIQKIREAERDVIYDKYSKKVGMIINGQVHRFEKGNMIVELDDTEALLPRSQQIPGERFRQGEDIRVYLLKVEKGTTGADIILSRACCEFVKELFELEVPEIVDGIVEIKGISREPGDRTKIAVYSKDERVDAVGACVGMKGSRVRDIVRELSGERIDIVRWNEDIREYVPAAVSPAEISKMVIDRENQRITLTVPQDQLSVLIGKKGRNIRLASKLVGWELKAESSEEEITIPMADIEGIEEEMKEKLLEAGYEDAERICNASVEQLMGIVGVDESTAALILQTARAAYIDAQARREEEKQAEKERAQQENEAEGGEGDNADVQDEQTEPESEECEGPVDDSGDEGSSSEEPLGEPTVKKEHPDPEVKESERPIDDPGDEGSSSEELSVAEEKEDENSEENSPEKGGSG